MIKEKPLALAENKSLNLKLEKTQKSLLKLNASHCIYRIPKQLSIYVQCVSLDSPSFVSLYPEIKKPQRQSVKAVAFISGFIRRLGESKETHCI